METGLVEAVERHELEGVQKNMFMLSKSSYLEFLLNDVYESHRPTFHDYAIRRDLIRIFNDMARDIYGNSDKCPFVEEFGSFLMEMFNVSSDLDLSINFSDKKGTASRTLQTKTLRKFAEKLFALQRKGLVKNVQQILSARVPVVKATDCGTGIECDLSVGNLDGITKSQIVLMVSRIDERFQKLCLLMKAWAKAHDINSSKDGTLNSLSLILLAAFHLQTREIPILPPFSAILKDGTDPAAVKNCISSFSNFGANNKESVAELFVSLLVKLESVEALWEKGLCASTYEGSWIFKVWKPSDVPKLGIEDFTDRSQNTSRALRSTSMPMIHASIRHSVNAIRLFANGLIDAVNLKHQLFGVDPAVMSSVITIANLLSPAQTVLPEPTKRKRKRKNKQPTVGVVEDKRFETSQESLGALALLAGQLMSASNLLLQGQGGFRLDSQVAQSSQFSQPTSYSNSSFRGSGLFGEASSRTESLSHGASTSHGASMFMAGNSKSVPNEFFQGYSEIRPRSTTINLLAGEPHSLPDVSTQEFGVFRQEGNHRETLRHGGPVFPASLTYASATRSSSVTPSYRHRPGYMQGRGGKRPRAP